MRLDEPAHFEALASIAWTFNNHAADSDYRARGPVIDVDADSRIRAVRYNSFLRASRPQCRSRGERCIPLSASRKST